MALVEPTLPTPPRSSQDGILSSSPVSSPSRLRKRKAQVTQESPSSSSMLSSPSRPVKRRAKPTITPRSFRRFFAPRNASERSGPSTSAREALTEIFPNGANVPRVDRNSPVYAKPQVFDEDENPKQGSNLASLQYITPGNSPNYRMRRTVTETVPHAKKAGLNLSRPACTHTNYVSRSSIRGALGALSLREVGLAHEAHLRLDPHSHLSAKWQSQVANFCSNPEDDYACQHQPLDSAGPPVMPFSIAACNTCPLVAVGDEQGSVRLLDTRRNSSAKLHPFLSFEPHNNAIIDMEFSANDFHLATASGDQDSAIIDMHTQQTIFSLRGHAFSVKQIRFQPGSDYNVIATSSRDGVIKLWDLRCTPQVPRPSLQVNMDGHDVNQPDPRPLPKLAACVQSIHSAHQLPIVKNSAFPTSSKSRYQASVTAISFINEARSHLLLSGSEANATIKLWDLRSTSRTRKSKSIGITREPNSHGQLRKFGLTSMALSGDGSRLYALCKDSTVYAYSVNHLALGTMHEMDNNSGAAKWSTNVENGLGPLYGMQHPSLRVPTFYTKSALRTCGSGKSEILAVGSAEACAILFPIEDGSSHNRQAAGKVNQSILRTPTAANTRSYSNAASNLGISQAGTALVHGHASDVTGLTWTQDGELVTIGDDFHCRVWREDADCARGLRNCGHSGGRRWGRGWAEIQAEDPFWDELE